tara:strand:- start:4328 stop:6748 length:2421 start_codon:yes stop_codon:yes gene_type:complete
MRIKLLALFSLMAVVGFAQHDHHEPFVEDDIMLTETIKKMYPELAPKIDAEEAKLEAFTKEYIANEHLNSSRADVDYIIPVVFHILHEGGPENVTDTEIHDAVRILNEDFQMINDDLDQVVSRFKNITGDAKIEFRLARRDPQGNPTTGIDRIYTSRTNNAGENSKLNPWPRSTYLNVWIAKSIGSGAAGYTFLPSTAHFRASKDGIILLYTYFASVRTGNDRRSRALTHEVGHWLNLPHPWGGSNTPGLSSNCSIDDGVGDTPLTIGWRTCNTNGISCGTFDNVQNFMEYSYCTNMFTQGQVSRMRAALNSGTAQRNQLVSTTNNRKAGVLDLDVAEFSSHKKAVCINEVVQYKDMSPYGAVTWKWEFEGGSPSTSNVKDPSVSYVRPGTYNVKLTVTDAMGNKKIKTVSDYIVVNKSVGDFLPFIESFEGSTESVSFNWAVENEDNDTIFWKVADGNAFTGNNYLMLENSKNIFNQVEGIISAPVDLSNILSPVLTLYIAHASSASGTFKGQTKFRILYSSDCGETWDLKYSNVSVGLNNGKQTNLGYFPQGNSDWIKISVNNFIGKDKVQNGLFKFEVENLGDNNFFIDNINMSGSFDDVPVLEFPTNNLDSVASSVFIDWKAVPVVDEYEYELSDKSDFSNIVYSGKKNYINASPLNDDTRFYAKNLNTSTSYYWRVRAHRGSISTNWSEVWTFTVSGTGEGKEFIDGGSSVGIDNTIQANEDFTFAIFPNPTQGEVNIRLESELNTNIQVNVYSLQGQKVWATEVSETSLVTITQGELTAGIYVVNLVANGKSYSKKLVVE